MNHELNFFWIFYIFAVFVMFLTQQQEFKCRKCFHFTPWDIAGCSLAKINGGHADEKLVMFILWHGFQ